MADIENIGGQSSWWWLLSASASPPERLRLDLPGRRLLFSFRHFEFIPEDNIFFFLAALIIVISPSMYVERDFCGG